MIRRTGSPEALMMGSVESSTTIASEGLVLIFLVCIVYGWDGGVKGGDWWKRGWEYPLLVDAGLVNVDILGWMVCREEEEQGERGED